MHIGKASFVKEFIESPAVATAILRPRRFGKTANLNLLESFLGPNNSVFTGINDQTFVEKNCGEYSVVLLDLKDCKGHTWDDLMSRIRLAFRELIERHHSVIEATFKNNLDAIARFWLNDIDGTVSYSAELAQTLKWITEAVHRNSKLPLILLIDDFDAPLNCALLNGYYEKAASFFCELYDRALNGNSSLYKACLMGTVNVGSRSVLPPNCSVFTVSDTKYAQFFGLTAEEIKSTGVSEKELFELVEWYGGFKIGGMSKVNPDYFSKWHERRNMQCQFAFSDDFINKILLENASTVLPSLFSILYDSSDIVSPLPPSIDYPKDRSASAILHILVNVGLLSYDTGRVLIPNQELRRFWKAKASSIVKFCFDGHFQTHVLEAFRSETLDVGRLGDGLNRIISFFQSTKGNPRALFLGFFLAISDEFLKVDDSCAKSDISIQYGSVRRVVIEFMRSQVEESLEQDAQRALAWVEAKDYVGKGELVLIGASICGSRLSDLRSSCKTRKY